MEYGREKVLSLAESDDWHLYKLLLSRDKTPGQCFRVRRAFSTLLSSPLHLAFFCRDGKRIAMRCSVNVAVHSLKNRCFELRARARYRIFALNTAER